MGYERVEVKEERNYASAFCNRNKHPNNSLRCFGNVRPSSPREVHGAPKRSDNHTHERALRWSASITETSLTRT